MFGKKALAVAGLVVALGGAQAASAGVKQGVDAWNRGDYAAAVDEWKAPAEAGDPDALFNLGQAYRLGRGVEKDLVLAERYFAQAAAQGHQRAADLYGLILFQDESRRVQAIPYVADAARRGDARSQYLMGIAYFNGDLVAKDWVKAYALLTLANGQDLPQAANAISQMDQYIPLLQRQQAQVMAREMQLEADAARAGDLATTKLASAGDDTPPENAPSTTPKTGARAAPVPIASTRPDPPAALLPKPAKPAPTSAPSNTKPASGGPWKIQLGAFAQPDNADRLWNKLSGRPEIAGRSKLIVPSGRVTLLLLDGFATKAEANAVCRELKNAGQDCLVISR